MELNFFKLYFEYLRSNGMENKAEINKALTDYGTMKWLELLEYDPIPSDKQFRGLTLVVIGAEDQTFAVEEVSEAINKNLSSNRIELMLIPKADHGLNIARDAIKPSLQLNKRSFVVKLAYPYWSIVRNYLR